MVADFVNGAVTGVFTLSLVPIEILILATSEKAAASFAMRLKKIWHGISRSHKNGEGFTAADVTGDENANILTFISNI